METVSRRPPLSPLSILMVGPNDPQVDVASCWELNGPNTSKSTSTPESNFMVRLPDQLTSRKNHVGLLIQQILKSLASSTADISSSKIGNERASEAQMGAILTHFLLSRTSTVGNGDDDGGKLSE